MGKIVLADNDGHKVEFIFEGSGRFRAHKDNKGPAFLSSKFHFVETDQEFTPEPEAEESG